MSADDEKGPEVVKYYTRARKFPLLLGKMQDGTKIPGGPYTAQQVIAGIVILVVGAKTMGFWGVFGGIANVLVLAGITFLTIWFVGRMPHGRNPLFMLLDGLNVLASSRLGKYKGRMLRIRRRHSLTHKVNVYYGPLPHSAQSINAAAERLGAEAGAEPGALRIKRVRPAKQLTASRSSDHRLSTPLTGVQALLAQADSEREEKEAR